MIDLAGLNVVVLDIETLKSADDCRHCGTAKEAHAPDQRRGDGSLWVWPCPDGRPASYAGIGWERKADLGLSIGCYWSYADMRLHWFDRHTLEATMRLFVEAKPLLVSFNGIQFDFSLMRGLLRQQADDGHECALWGDQVRLLCDQFKALCASSYDLLAEIWTLRPEDKLVRGLNSLDVLCRANGLPLKEMDGASAPRLWAQGRYAEVLTYCAGDVERTRLLFEMVCAGKPIIRGDGESLRLPPPMLPALTPR